MAAPAERWTISSLLETAGRYLKEKDSSSPRLDAELLLAETLGFERIQLYTQFDRPLPPAEVQAYRALIARRAAHEPVAYILGRAYFRHLVLEVGPSVLIPRPETEELVDAALRVLRRRPPWDLQGAEGPAGEDRAAPRRAAAPLVADVGTGSGAIALSIAQEAGARVLAVDDSEQALAMAARNAERLSLTDGVELRCADLLAGVPDASLHVVVSNPPYVTSDDLQHLAPDVRSYEPHSALEAGPDGLDVIRRLLPEAARALRPGGTVLLEVGDGQASDVERLAEAAGFTGMTVHKDMSGKERIIEAILPGAVPLPIAGLSEGQLEALRLALKEGAILGVPTDTVYGLAARWDSALGVRGLFVAKGRVAEQVVAAVFSSVEEVERTLADLDPLAVRVMRDLLPGPYTFVVKTQVVRVPLVGTDDSLGVRVPDHLGLRGLVASIGTPLAATSANLSGHPDAQTMEAVHPWVLAHCSAAFIAAEKEASQGGTAVDVTTGLASTVVDLRPLSDGETPRVLRAGAVSEADVLRRIAEIVR